METSSCRRHTPLSACTVWDASFCFRSWWGNASGTDREIAWSWWGSHCSRDGKSVLDHRPHLYCWEAIGRECRAFLSQLKRSPTVFNILQPQKNKKLQRTTTIKARASVAFLICKANPKLTHTSKGKSTVVYVLYPLLLESRALPG